MGSTAGGKRRRKWSRILGVICVSGGVAYLLLAPRPDEVRTFELALANGNRVPITVDCFFPPSESEVTSAPAVVLLHGVEGTRFYRWGHLRNARRIADEGFVVMLVHYFDALPYDDLAYLKDGELDTARVEEHIYGDSRQDRAVWGDTVSAAMKWVGTQPEVDSNKVFLVGYSLGGFLALSYANECDNEEGAQVPRGVVVNFASRFRDVQLSGKIPPMQFHHGELDEVVDVEWMRQVLKECQDLGVDVEGYVYLGQGHMLEGEAAELCRDRTHEFFDRLLQTTSRSVALVVD